MRAASVSTIAAICSRAGERVARRGVRPGVGDRRPPRRRRCAEELRRTGPQVAEHGDDGDGADHAGDQAGGRARRSGAESARAGGRRSPARTAAALRVVGGGVEAAGGVLACEVLQAPARLGQDVDVAAHGRVRRRNAVGRDGRRIDALAAGAALRRPRRPARRRRRRAGRRRSTTSSTGRRAAARRRAEPEQRRGRLQRRPVQHEVAVARRHVVDDLARRSCPGAAARGSRGAGRPRGRRSNRRCVWFWQTRQRSSAAMRVIRASSAGSAARAGLPWRPRAPRRARAAAAPIAFASVSGIAASAAAARSCSRSRRGVSGPMCLSG